MLWLTALRTCTELKPALLAGIAALMLVAIALGQSIGTAGNHSSTNFRALAFYSPNAEPDHVLFANDAVKFFSGLAAKRGFSFETSTDWADLNAENLKKYQVVIWMTDTPNDPAQRQAFQQYMDSGGAWLGFHCAGYNDKDTNWQWYADFLGAVFYTNSWPPLPARLIVDDRTHPATASLPEAYMAPANEWYIWKPNPRLNKDIRVLMTLDPANYPLGLKDILLSGDLPVVWSNTKYRMIYMNMGHGDKIFKSPTQNKLFEDALMALGTRAAIPPALTKREVAQPEPAGVRVSPRAVAVNAVTHKAYGVNPDRGTVTVNEATGASKTIQVGTEPAAIAINSSANKIYVANGGSGTVSVIDGATDSVTATVEVGSLPYVIAVNSKTDRVYISRTFANTMTVIDGKTNQTHVIKPGIQADTIAIDESANKIYGTSYEGDKVTVIDGANETISTVVIDKHLWGVATDQAMGKIYLTGSGTAKLWTLDEKANSPRSVNVRTIPTAVAFDATAHRIYVANYESGSVSVVDADRDLVLSTIQVVERPQAIAVNSQTHRVYVVSPHASAVSVIDGLKSSVVATLKAGNGPYAIAADSASNRAYIGTLAGELIEIDGDALAVRH